MSGNLNCKLDEYYLLFNAPLNEFIINWEAKSSSTDVTEK